MPKPAKRTYSAYSTQAMRLLGVAIKAERKPKKCLSKNWLNAQALPAALFSAWKGER
ncbi:MAG: hypothetical protein Q9M45_14600 [Robiginitomaculum sp.]|nr:hypothetical protein [Robiginitomaculum sp.]